jgi:AraC-like DNA-binding protein
MLGFDRSRFCVYDWDFMWRSIQLRLTRLSMRAELLVVLGLMALLPAVIVHLHAAHRIDRLVRQEVAGYGNQIVERAAGQLDLLIAQVEVAQQQIVAHVLDSPHFMRADTLTLRERRRLAEMTDAYLKALKWSFHFISAIYVINWDRSIYSSYSSAGMGGSDYYSGERLLRTSWIRAVAQKPLAEAVVAPHVPHYVYPDTAKQMPVVPFAKNFDTFGKEGLNTIVQIDLDFVHIESLLAGVNLGKGGLVALVDSEGLVLACPAARHLVGAALRGPDLPLSSATSALDGSIGARRPLENIDWALVGIIPTERILKQYGPLKTVMYVVFALVVIGGIGVAAYVSARLTAPIRRFIRSVQRATEGDTEVDIPDVPTKELHAMSETVESIVAEMNRLMQESLVRDRERRQAESRIKVLSRMLTHARSQVEKLLCDQERLQELTERLRIYERLLRTRASASSSDPPAAGDARICRALSYIEDRYDDRNLCLNEVASQVFMEPTYFSTKFKKETGTGFSVYLRQLRLERAEALLMNPGLKICDVARMVGYGDAHYFSRVFTRCRGTRPSEYRRGVTANHPK